MSGEPDDRSPRVLVPAPRPPSGAYVGYRWPGAGGVLRLPSGDSATLGRDAGAARRLAQRVLRDRLRRRPAASLLDAFLREWVRPARRGEFVWPVEAIDEWLDAATADASRHAGARPDGTRGRTRPAPPARRLVAASAPTTPGAH